MSLVTLNMREKAWQDDGDPITVNVNMKLTTIEDE